MISIVDNSLIERGRLATDDLSVKLSTTSSRAAMAWRARKYGSPASLLIASEVPVKPHNQTFAIAIQLDVIGTLALRAMWIAHFPLFRSCGITAWLGTVIVVDNGLFNRALAAVRFQQRVALCLRGNTGRHSIAGEC